jgi:hypothetical protein
MNEIECRYFWEEHSDQCMFLMKMEICSYLKIPVGSSDYMRYKKIKETNIPAPKNFALPFK